MAAPRVVARDTTAAVAAAGGHHLCRLLRAAVPAGERKHRLRMCEGMRRLLRMRERMGSARPPLRLVPPVAAELGRIRVLHLGTGVMAGI